MDTKQTLYFQSITNTDCFLRLLMASEMFSFQDRIKRRNIQKQNLKIVFEKQKINK